MDRRSRSVRPFHFGAHVLLVQRGVIGSVATPACRRPGPLFGFPPREACQCGIYGAGRGLVLRMPWPSMIV
jgi:hypothetical protein